MGSTCCADTVRTVVHDIVPFAPEPPAGLDINFAAAPFAVDNYAESPHNGPESSLTPPPPAYAPVIPTPDMEGHQVIMDDNDPFVSQVGELQKFDRNDGEVKSKVSESSDTSELVDGIAKDQKQTAKLMVKKFVREMVKGRDINVMTETGQIKTCKVSITRDLTQLKIAAGGGQRLIILKSIMEILPGAEVQGIATPADELCATLVFDKGDCITFRLENVEDRDAFVSCMSMFCDSSKKK